MPYAKIDLNRSCLPESKKQPISLDRLLLFLVLYHRCRNVVLRCIMMSYAELLRLGQGIFAFPYMLA